MAKNEIKVNITAETTQFERNIASLKNKLGEAFLTPNQFSLGALSPWKMASDFIIKKGLEIIDAFKNWRKGLEDISSATDRTAKDLDTTTLQASRLEAAARAAGVSAKDYAQAIDNIKSGKTSLENQAEQWERIAGSAKTAQERTRSFAALIEAERKQQHENATAAENISATLSGLKGSGTIAQSFLEEITRGRTAPITGQEFAKRGAQLGISYRNMGGNETIDLALKALNRAIAEELSAREAATEKERKAKEALLKKEEEARLKALEEEEKSAAAAQKSVAELERIEADRRAKVSAAAEKEAAAFDARAKEAYALAQVLERAYSLSEASERLQEVFGADAEALYKRGATLAESPEKQARELAEKTIAQRQELEASRKSLEGQKADVEKQLASYKAPLSRPDFITAAGGSLIGSGSFTLQQAQRLAAIEKQDTQKEQLAQLKEINAAIRALDE